MSEMIAQNWWLLLAALLIGIVVAWWIFAINDRTRIDAGLARDVMEEGAAPAARNSALMDAPPAAAVTSKTATPPAHKAETAAGDDLTRLKGVGPKLSALLHGLGITSFAQIASWSDADVDRIDAQLGNFSGRIRRDSWREQAAFLAKGDMQGFEGKFGKL